MGDRLRYAWFLLSTQAPADVKADNHPESQVIGTELSNISQLVLNIQSTLLIYSSLPPNLDIYLDDAEDEWSLRAAFDFRSLARCVHLLLERTGDDGQSIRGTSSRRMD